MPWLKSFFLFLITLLISTTCSASYSGRILIGLNDQWVFKKEGGSSQRINLPHTWNALDVLDDQSGYYRGLGIYSRSLKTDGDWKGKKLFLVFHGVAQECQIFINGKLAGSHVGSYSRFIVPISDLLNYKSDEIEVRVNNNFNENIPPLTGDFTFFGGIYRNVELLVTAPVHFSNQEAGSSGLFVSTPRVSVSAASVEINAVLQNQSMEGKQISLNTSLYRPDGVLLSTQISNVKLAVGASLTVKQITKEILNPKLWSPEHPNLYRLITRIIDRASGEILDELSSPLGLRWFSFDARKGFFLNGKSLKLIGASRHQDYEHLGNAVPDALQIKDVELLKQMGGNFLRVAHYPQDRSVLEACDRLGVLTSVEIPIVNTITETAEFTGNALQMQTEMIKQNFNHPSVIIWAYMNEVLLRPKFADDKTRQQLYFEHVHELAEKLEALTRKLDPLRYTMLVNHGSWDLYNKVGLTKIPMIVGWNLYSGWYSEDINDFEKFLDRHQRELPEKPMMVTEYGADADPRIRSFTPVRFDKSVDYAIKFHQHYLNAMLSRPHVSGMVAWNLADFNSETREESMPHINNKGLLTIGRQPKDTYFLYQAYLSTSPYLKILAPQWLNRTGMATTDHPQNSIQSVQVATNQKSAVLFLNGHSLGKGSETDHIISWQVPFINGKNVLRVVADTVQDELVVNFQLQASNFRQDTIGFQEINVMLGARRYYIDEKLHQVWIPEQSYHKGSWGYIGGKVYKGNNNRIPYGSDRNVLITENDPVYQTQRQGISAFKFDVADGEYELRLHFAELVGGEKKEALAYNLDDHSKKEQQEQRLFDVQINGLPFLSKINLAEDYGYLTAVEKTTRISVTGGNGIEIGFIAIKGEPVLNGIQLKKIY